MAPGSQVFSVFLFLIFLGTRVVPKIEYDSATLTDIFNLVKLSSKRGLHPSRHFKTSKAISSFVAKPLSTIRGKDLRIRSDHRQSELHDCLVCTCSRPPSYALTLGWSGFLRLRRYDSNDTRATVFQSEHQNPEDFDDLLDAFSRSESDWSGYEIELEPDCSALF